MPYQSLLFAAERDQSQLLFQFNVGRLRSHGIFASIELQFESFARTGYPNFDDAGLAFKLVGDIGPGQVLTIFNN